MGWEHGGSRIWCWARQSRWLELDLRQKREREREGEVVIGDPPPTAWGWPNLSLLGRWGGLRPPTMAGSLFFCSPEKQPEMGGGWRRWRWQWLLGRRSGCLIVCFILILSFCIFLNMLMCHLEIGRQKNPWFLP